MIEIPRFHIHSFGCKVNRAEMDSVMAFLLGQGWTHVRTPDEADITIINTCTVTGEADTKNRKYIHGALRSNEGPILVTGCAINIATAAYEGLDSRVACEPDKSAVGRRACALLGWDIEEGTLQASASIEATTSQVVPSRDGDNFRTRADVKVQDGCDNACTFCIVHTARGPARSTPLSQVVEEVRELAAAGVEEVVLVGINLGAYRDGEMDLTGLLETLMVETEIGRIRLSSIEPQTIDDRLIACLAASEGRICRHLHIPLQSGSDKVLRQMARHYDSATFLSVIDRLRQAIPSIALSTDMIVGFPGEGEEDAHDSLLVAEASRFMRIHVFRYSRRPGTPAAQRDDHVDPQTIARRAGELRELGDRLAAEDRDRRVGTVERVIMETPRRGTSESYHTVICDEEAIPGTLVDMEFVGVDGKALVGRIIAGDTAHTLSNG